METIEKKIYFIDDSESFVIKMISQELSAVGLMGTAIEPLDVGCLSEVKKNMAEFIIVNVDEDTVENQQGLFFLRDMCVDDGHKLCFIGYAEDIATIKKAMQLQPKSVAMEFERPINAKEVVAAVKKLFDDAQSEDAKKHVLVVDDSGTMLTTIKGWLEDKYRVTIVNSAMNAITFLAVTKPDLILLDYEMPVCNGPQFLSMIKADVKTEDIPVMFLTGRGDVESVKSAVALKPEGYLLKSMPKEHIVQQIDEFFEKQRIKNSI